MAVAMGGLLLLLLLLDVPVALLLLPRGLSGSIRSVEGGLPVVALAAARPKRPA